MKTIGKKRILVIIPARGGSKRFPGKNIYPLKGKPLIGYPIEAAKKSQLIDRIVVSTDDEKIAAIAKKFGAEIPFMRPAKLATDVSPVIKAVCYTVKKLEKGTGYKADYIILIQATSPLITAEQIDEAIKLAIVKNADSVVGVTAVNNLNHPYNIRKITKKGTIKFSQNKLHYKYLGKKKPDFYHAGALWLTNYNTLFRDKKLEGKKNYPLILDQFYLLDIDFKEDLELIEAYLDVIAKRNKNL
jgi:CMP-N-acetylneuraminic acid synthetase